MKSAKPLRKSFSSINNKQQHGDTSDFDNQNKKIQKIGLNNQLKKYID